jgi:hypothetical protein
LSVAVEATGKVLTLPYSYRKIRKISDGWAVAAGEYTSATAILDLLKQQDAILFAQARRLLIGNSLLLNSVATKTGIALDRLLDTVILAAPRGTSAAGWTLSLRPNDNRTFRRVADFAINWPLAVPQDERLAAEASLKQTLRHAHAGTTALTYAKAMGRIISTAARYAPDVGPYIQIGETLPVASSGRRSIYFEGTTAELLALDEEAFDRRCELAI